MKDFSKGIKVKLTLSESCYTRIINDALIFDTSPSKIIENVLLAYCKDSAFVANILDPDNFMEMKARLTELFAGRHGIYFEKTIAKLVLNKNEKLSRKHLGSDVRIYYWTMTRRASEAVEADYASQNQGATFICELLEEYATLPYYKREYIQLSKLISTIQVYIKSKQSFEFLGSGPDWYVIHPYKILTDPDLQYTYAVGHVVKKGSPEEEGFEPSYSNVGCLRVLNVRDIRKTQKAAKINSGDIEKKLSTHQPAFMVEEITNVEVLLTEQGTRIFKAVLQNRPKIVAKEANVVYKGNTYYKYTVACTPFQAKIYFSTFGNSARVISPDYVEAAIKEQLTAAMNMYEDE